jgi:heme oxygenase
MGPTAQLAIDPRAETTAELVAPFDAPVEFLSVELRLSTAEAHRAVEVDLGLPDSVADLEDYRRCLAAFYRLYRPLEAALAAFDDWTSIGVEIAARAHTPRLAVDLSALGLDPQALPDARSAALPVLSNFATALGALYVLEGSTLGGRVILRLLQERLGERIRDASAFFGGHGARTAESWKEFKQSLDRYGAAHPDRIRTVVDGANTSFRCIGSWMRHDQHCR